MNSTSKKHIYIPKFINLVLSVFMLFTCINFTSIKAIDDGNSDGNDNANEYAVIAYHIVEDDIVDSEASVCSRSQFTFSERFNPSDSSPNGSLVTDILELYDFIGWYELSAEGEWTKVSDETNFVPTAPEGGWVAGTAYQYYARFAYKDEYLRSITVEAYWIDDQGKEDAKPFTTVTTATEYKIGKTVTLYAKNYFSNVFGYQLINENDSQTFSARTESDKNVVKFYNFYKRVCLQANSSVDKLYTGNEITVTPGFISYLPTDSTKTDLGLTFSGVTASGSGTEVGTYDVTISKDDGGDIEYTAVDSTEKYIVSDVHNSTFNIVSEFPEFKFASDEYGGSYTYSGSPIKGNPVATTVTNGTTIRYRSSTDDGDNWSSWTTVQPSRTDVGTTKVQVEATNPNYTDTLETEYTLTVTAKDMSLVSLSVEDVNYYDGTEHEQNPTVTDSERRTTLVKDTDYTLSYSDDVVNAGEVTVTVTGIGNYTGTKSTTYKINSRPVTLVSGSSEKEYDGTALTNSTVNYAQGSLEFVTGEYPDIQTTGTITDVVKDDKGNDTSVPNTFVVKESEDSNYKASNYTITKQEGTLKVTHIGTNITVYIQGNTDTYEYDGEYHGISGYKVTEVEGTKKDLYDVTKNIKFTGDLNANTYKDVNTQADGYPGSIYVKDFQNISNNFSNVSFIVNQGTVIITPRTYTITTESATKSYDGKALTASGKVVGLVDGDSATFTITGSQTEVGSSKNTYKDFEFTGDTKATNYTHGEDIIGTLTVVEKSSDKSSKKSSGGWDDGGPFTTDKCGNVFDRWGNKIYEAKGCNVGGYNLVSTSVED